MIDWLVLHLNLAVGAVEDVVGGRSPWEWMMIVVPPLLFLELPRYYLPLVWAVIMRRLRPERQRTEPERRFLETAPLVSVVVAGRNEEDIICRCIESLLAQDYPNLEILVVDDHSEDRMYERASAYARRGQVRLIRNNSERGRTGRPSASNLGLRMANGEIMVSLDADTVFDPFLVSSLVAPFADPRVGVVAGNVLISNWRENWVTRLQALEYAVAIDINKRWTDVRGATLQASGAVGAFRRKAVAEIGGWEQQLAEDTDVSLRMRKAGWKLAFAPRAVARTFCPTKLGAVAKQRRRWDRGGTRAFFKKHYRLMNPAVGGWGLATELWAEFLFAVVATAIYPFYVLYLLWQGPIVFGTVLVLTYVTYTLLSLATVAAVAYCTERIEQPWAMLRVCHLNPYYKEVLRWVRFWALVLEVVRIRYEDPFLPESAWVHAPRY